MRKFNEFCCEKEIEDFKAYLQTEARKYPEAFSVFVQKHARIDELWNPFSGWGRKKQAAGTDADPIPLQQAPADQQPLGSDANPIPLKKAPKNNPNLPIAASGGKPAVYPGQNDPNTPIAAGQGKPAVYPGQGNNQNIPFGQDVDDGTGSKVASQAIDKLLPNIIKVAQQKNPGSVQQVQQLVNTFKQQWSQFKQQVPQLLGFQGVKNPQKHGLTYGLAPNQ